MIGLANLVFWRVELGLVGLSDWSAPPENLQEQLEAVGEPEALESALEALEDQQRGLFEDVVAARFDLWWVVLLAIVVVVGAYVWGGYRRRQLRTSLGNPLLIDRLLSTVNPVGRILKSVCMGLAVLFVGFALIRPQYGGTAKLVPAGGLDIVLVVDYSKSMLAEDVYPSRNERLESELARFLKEADKRGDRVGVVVFAGAARGMPVTRDSRLLRLFLERADPLTERPGGTAIGKGLTMALEFLIEARAETRTDDGEEQESDQIIILLTDGEDTTSRPLEVAERARELGVRIYTVGIGSTSGEPIQQFTDSGERNGYVMDDDGNYVMARLDEKTLESLAEATDGAYIKVDADRFALDDVRDLTRDLSRSQRRDEIEIDREEGYAWPLLAAFVLLVFGLAIPERRFNQEGSQ